MIKNILNRCLILVRYKNYETRTDALAEINKLRVNKLRQSFVLISCLIQDQKYLWSSDVGHSESRIQTEVHLNSAEFEFRTLKAERNAEKSLVRYNNDSASSHT